MNRFLDIRSYFQKVGFAFRALRIRNFKLFFSGQIISLLGTWIQNIALGWLIYRLTGSAFWLGIVGFAGQIPALFLTPFAGVFADRLNRRKILILVQIIPMILAFTMATLVITDRIQVWQIILIASINGMVMAFDTPFRHAFLLEMVGEKELLQNAIALNSTLINSARFIGPMIGGILIAAIGEGGCFIVNGVSFLAVVFALISMKVIPATSNKEHGSILTELKEGFQYSFNFKPIRYLLILVVSTSFFGLPFQVFLPVFAKEILSGDSQMLGFLTGAVGAGALTGAFFLASQRSIKRLPNFILISAILFGLGLMGFSLSTFSALSIPLLFVVGFGMISQYASANTLLQTIVDDSKRGRVMAFYGMSFLGITPLGSLLLGTVTKSIGVPYTLLISGTFCLIAAAFYARRKKSILLHIQEKQSLVSV
ncbi:MAG TPA: MFS transporter [Tenuifilaceae bacterium]|nr:MFS transporter [Tenuifilaceae bacterium]HPE17213.1 MFS transporter [Tenuifilaceae bacterium]HPJ44739.1 MFS transporter [Tenuifilaceae bacterium]HPQ33325.1 MFS transporter [Tenuifilaceae bacterium]HRX68652.1 MFS transporter [Tenuifilaceae bacterium]